MDFTLILNAFSYIKAVWFNINKQHIPMIRSGI